MKLNTKGNHRGTEAQRTRMPLYFLCASVPLWLHFNLPESSDG